jgi:subtilisin-like proprotein convertase family protein
MEPFVFGTVVESCGTFSANDLPKVISASGAPTVESVVTLNAGGAVSDVNVKSVQGNHTFFKDLELTLIGPDGTSVALSKDKCGSYNGQFKFGFDDDTPTAFSCPPSTGVAFKPASPLSAFKGKNAAGPWTLRVKDNVTSSGGNLAGFELEICSSVALTPPFIVTNNTLELPGGSNALIANTLLKAEDANNSAAQLTYTLVTVPKYGELQINAVVALPGTQFSQADLDNGALRYFDFGSGNGGQFRFVVTDGEGGFVEGNFVIKAAVRVFEPAQRLAFDLAPNPATESLRISFGESLSSDARVSMFNTAGQQLRSLALPSGTLTYLLDVANLPDGVYIVTVQNERASGARKVVVRH